MSVCGNRSFGFEMLHLLFDDLSPGLPQHRRLRQLVERIRQQARKVHTNNRMRRKAAVQELRGHRSPIQAQTERSVRATEVIQRRLVFSDTIRTWRFVNAVQTSDR